MKRKLFHIITTIILCVVLCSSFILSASAAESYSLKSSFVRYNNVLVPSTISTIPTEFGGAVLGVSIGTGFDKYVTTNNDIVYDGTTDFLVVSAFYDDLFYENLSGVNSFEVSYGLIGSAGETQTSAEQFKFVSVSLNGVSLLPKLTVTYDISAPTSVTIPDGSGTQIFYRTVTARVLCDSSVELKNGDALVFACRSRVLNLSYNGSYVGLRYCFGFSDLTVDYKTVDDYIEDVAKNTSAISSTVTVISDQLATKLTDEQQAKLQKNAQIMQDRYDQEEEIQDEYDKIQDIITSNGYDVFEDANTEDIGQVEDNYQNLGLSVLADSIWDSTFVVSAIGMVVLFVAIKIGLFGL